jgi:opine dehydrogenase
VARWTDTHAPIAHGLLAIAGGWQGCDLRQGPRTLEGLGLHRKSRDELQQVLHEGE